MSNLVFPVLPGLALPWKRSPRWSTRRRYTASGRRFATTYWTYPIWTYRLSFEFLRRDLSNTELESLAAFFNVHRGAWDSFLYLDPDDNAVSALQIGVGDGTSTDFALLRAIGSYSEPVGERNVITNVTINGSPTGAYTLLENRIVRFNTAPAAGQVLRWTGTYYMRCAFVDDEMDLEKFMAQYWTADGVEFETVKG